MKIESWVSSGNVRQKFLLYVTWIDEKVTVYVQAAEPAHKTNYVIQKS